MAATRATLELPAARAPLIAGVAVGGLAVATAWISPLLMPVVAGAAVLTVATLRRPWLGVALLVASVPVQQMGAVAGVTATRVALVVALAGYAASLLAGREPVRGTPLLIPFVALLAWMVATIGVADDPISAGAEVFRWTTALVTFVLAIHFLAGRPPRRLTAIVATIGIAGAFEALIGTVLGLVGFGPESFAVAGSISRAYGSFGRPNSFAGYLEMSLFPALWLGMYYLARTWGHLGAYRLARLRGFPASQIERHALAGSLGLTALLGGSAAMMLVGILVSFSRGAWLGVVAGFAVSGLLALRRRIVVALALAPAALLLVTLALGTVAPSTLTDRITSIADEARPFDAASIPITPENFAVVERMAHWQAGWRMFQDHPLTGIGAGNFNERYPDYFVRTEFRTSQGHAHNYFIHILAETGIVGLLLYLTAATSFFVLSAIVALRSTDLMARFVALGSAGTMAAVYVHNVFENLHVLNLSIVISAAWAMAVVAHQIWRASDRPVATSLNMEYSPR